MPAMTKERDTLEDQQHAKCRVLGQILDRVGDKWTIMAVGALSDGPMRFNAIMRRIDGVSHRMLTLTLRGLERDGMVRRTAYATIPPKVEYELTPLGRSLTEPLATLLEWGEKHSKDIEIARKAFDSDA
ncbi:winged helix-turn-helix transcriptional regulator [Agrobacterium larrymoorei]|uniref:Transcriptional regulator n=2 Tax=Agrobacterium larrymoorei TaxID=160699 RepID=A0A4D7DXB9_9HYPH|nr:helix-turn-helix domain-containing protein [Agrobacterium larrymoorei]QCJ00929.1 transcriptional regulator [Agrobacterium larrymoorei]QYA10263.1 helix-turn-helix transcriptional regulator [Agrobacterium larrymoorei]